MTTDPILSDFPKSDQTPDDQPGETVIVDYAAVVQAARLLIRAWLPTLTAPADPEPEEGRHGDAA